jgi:hypothetical protein
MITKVKSKNKTANDAKPVLSAADVRWFPRYSTANTYLIIWKMLKKKWSKLSDGL